MQKLNLSFEKAAVRENRLGSITGYWGNACDLVDCSQCEKLKDRPRSFSQPSGCSLSPASCLLLQIQDAVVINYAPVGCSSGLHEYEYGYKINANNRNVKNVTQRHIFTTNLKEKDIVYGGAAKLEYAIRQVYKELKPKAIFITTSCASAIIGDDIDSIVKDATEELGIPVCPVYCEGFRSKIWTSGFDASYHAIAKYIVKTPNKKKNDVVNIINFWGTDVFTRWFEKLGLKANYITPYATIEQISEASESIASVHMCSTLGSYLAAALETNYGVKAVKTSPPFGIKQTERWFRELGQITGKEKEVEAFIAEERSYWLPQIEELRKKLSGKKMYIVAGASHGQSLMAVARELGMEVIGASVYHHDPKYDNQNKEQDTLNHVVNDYGNIENYHVCNKQEFEVINAINRVKPDILVARHAGTTRWGAKNGIPSLMIMDEHFGLGYEGIIKYGKRIYDVIDHDEFVINLKKHAITPYSSWWLEQSPNFFLQK